ncbi:endonuclease/exonuclease/phosphatase family protein [Hyphomonas atlantica corrig.]|uniref:endonuclease/exonuclease/phosphatase family protein n=1 Tax=Hyphomonas atlantica TaxID=1280948 RepID=UPI0023530AC6|nr:endonuclease/exonuclease/phosphatase family protein [Hyphomonas atlantica]
MAQTWRIATYNTWKCDGLYRDRLNWMGLRLQALAPDILCLQEAFDCTERNANTARHLSGVLGMTAEVLSARRKHRAFEQDNRMSNSSLAILSKHDMTRKPDMKLAEHEDDRDRWAMQVNVSTGLGWRLRIVNTHLTHIRGKTGDLVRKSQAGQLASICTPLDREIVILCGDLNDDWHSESLSAVRKLEWLRAQYEVDGGTWLGPRGSARSLDRRIDQVQAVTKSTGGVNVLRRFPALNTPVGQGGEYASDHAALVIDLELRPPHQGAV